MRENFIYDRKTCAELLRNTDTFGTVLLVILLNAYGESLFDMDPLEIYADVENDFNAVMSEENENRLNAIMLCLASDAFYLDVDVFRSVATCLHDGDLGDLVSGQLEDLTVPEILWAIYEVGLLREDEPDFSPQISALIADELREEAEDSENVLEDVPYYERFMMEAKSDLAAQLSSIGVKAEDLAILG